MQLQGSVVGRALGRPYAKVQGCACKLKANLGFMVFGLRDQNLSYGVSGVSVLEVKNSGCSPLSLGIESFSTKAKEYLAVGPCPRGPYTLLLWN